MMCCFLRSCVQNDFVVHFKMSDVLGISSVRTLKITQADCYCSINNLEPNGEANLRTSSAEEH